MQNCQGAILVHEQLVVRFLNTSAYGGFQSKVHDIHWSVVKVLLRSSFHLLRPGRIKSSRGETISEYIFERVQGRGPLSMQ